MTLDQYYRRVAIYPGLIALGIVLLFNLFYYKDLHGEIISFQVAVIFYASIALFCSCVMGILSLTVYLLQYKKIRSNIILRFAAWFFLPAAFLLICVNAAVTGAISSTRVNPEWKLNLFYLLLFASPYFVSFTRHFKKFKKDPAHQ